MDTYISEKVSSAPELSAHEASESSASKHGSGSTQCSTNQVAQPSESSSSSLSKESEIDTDSLEDDPGLRRKISDFDRDIQNAVRRAYLLRGPCQPRHLWFFPSREIGGTKGKFNPSWFDDYWWLEYSVERDGVYCLPCYLFGHDTGKRGLGTGFVSLNRKDELDVHTGGILSVHNVASRKCEDLMKGWQNGEVFMGEQSEQMKRDYRIALEASIDCIKFMIRMEWIFHKRPEPEFSDVPSLFADLLNIYVSSREEMESIMLGDLQMTSPDIEKDIVHAIAAEITLDIIGHLGDDFFAIFVDEAIDMSAEVNMAIVLRYVDQEGFVEERFLGISRIVDFKASILKTAIESMLIDHGLSLSNMRGQSYNGGSNMTGEINELKNLILAENKSAYYVHCSTDQLELTVVYTAMNQVLVSAFFSTIAKLINLLEASCKGSENSQFVKLAKALFRDEPKTRRGLDQGIDLEMTSDTYQQPSLFFMKHWRSPLKTLVILDVMFSDVIDVLDDIKHEKYSEAKSEAYRLLILLQHFDFVFIMKMMIRVLSITNALSNALQMKDQQILHALHLVPEVKYRLQDMREKEWGPLLDEVFSLCKKEYIDIPNMDDLYTLPGRTRRNALKITNLHHYQVEVFYTVIAKVLQELNSLFDVANIELLNCVACLVPDDSFKGFNKQMVAKLATFYPNEFSDSDVRSLDSQLDAYIQDMLLDERFRELKGIEELSRKMVATNKHMKYPLVYLLVKLALILPVPATRASAEKTFTAMVYLKEKLLSRIGSESMDDYLMAYIERDIVEHISSECILEYM